MRGPRRSKWGRDKGPRDDVIDPYNFRLRGIVGVILRLGGGEEEIRYAGANINEKKKGSTLWPSETTSAADNPRLASANQTLPLLFSSSINNPSTKLAQILVPYTARFL